MIEQKQRRQISSSEAKQFQQEFLLTWWMIMAMNGLDLLRMIRGNKFFFRILALFIFMALNMGCTRADVPSEYRESHGKVTKFTVEVNDLALMIATPFIKLQDGSVIKPTLYYYQYHNTLIGGRDVEKIGRIFKVIGRDVRRISRAYYLPTSKEIATYLLLVRTSVLKEGKKPKAKPDKADYEMGDWQLLEIDAKDLSPEKPLVIPAYEELAKRELTKEQKELQEDLRKRFEVLEAAAWKKAATPTKPGDKRPWWRW